MRYRVLAKARQGGARQPPRSGGQDSRRDQAAPGRTPASRPQVSGREKHLYSIYKKMQEKNLSFSQVLDIYGFRVIVKDVPACYLALGALHSLYKPMPGQVQGLHRDSQGQRLPVAAHHAVRPVRHARSKSRSAPRRCTTSPRPASPRTGCTRPPTPASTSCSSKTHQWLQCLLEMQSRERRLGRVPRAPQGRPVPGRGLRVHAQGQDHGAAARRDRGRFRLRRAHRHRQPLRRRQDQPRAGAAAHRAQERRPRRDHHRAARQAQSGLAQLRRDRQGALAHPPLPQDHAVRGIGRSSANGC